MKNHYITKRYWNYKEAPLSLTNEMVKKYDNIIDLSIGDPDYPADKGIIEAMYKAGLEGHTRYTEFLGDEELRRATMKWYKEDYGYTFAEDEILITSGGTHSLYLTMETILDDGDEVIVIAPYYIYYQSQIELPRGKIVVYNTKSEDNFDIRPEELEKCITYRTKAIIVNSPANPSGKVYSPKNIQAIMDLAEKYDLLVIADEIYGALNYTNNKKPVFVYEDSPNRVITVYTYSKDFSFTGLRLGHIVANKELVETMRRINEAVSFTINAMVQKGGVYALEHRHEIQKGLYEEYYKRTNYIYERVQRIKNMKCNKPEGTFYVFIDIKDTGYSSDNMWQKVLDEAHVLLLPGNGFGAAGEGYMRIAATVDIDVLSEAFDRIERMDCFG